MEKQYNLAIKNNNTGAQERCAICGEWDEMLVGLTMTLAESWAHVCDKCAAEHDPWLHTALTDWRTNREKDAWRAVGQE